VNVAPVSNTVVFQEPALGVPVTGAAFPTANTLEPLGGYLIEFTYFRAKPQVTALTDSLYIPFDYFDVLVSGVNYFTAQFLKDADAATYWKSEFDAGVIGMIRDKNLFPRGPEFINPDPSSVQTQFYYGYETIDQSNFPYSSG
jgi:hypothetical protein